MNKVSLHNHTSRCGHAFGDMEEYCREAVKQGVSVLGFSDHGPFPDGRYPLSRMSFDELGDYRADIERMRLKFPELTILAGLEVDYLPMLGKSYYEDIYGGYNLDYMIVGTHAVEPSRPENEVYGGAVFTPAITRLYMETMIAAMETGLFAYVAHPDLFGVATREWTEEHRHICLELIRAAKALGVPLEINSYGLRKPWIDTPEGVKRPGYPWRLFWDLVGAEGAGMVVGPDAHLPQDVWSNTPDAIAFGAESGLEPRNAELAARIIGM